MRVLLATHFFPPNHPGGTEAYTYSLARTLASMGHSPHVICAERWGEGSSFEPRHEDTVYDGIPVRRLYWNWQLAPDPFVAAYDNRRVQEHVERYLRSLRPDVVHVTSCYTLGAGTILAARRVGVPTFLTLTDFWFLCPRHTLLRGDGSLCPGPESAATCARCLAAGSTLGKLAESLLPSNVATQGLLLAGRWPAVGRRSGFRGYVGDASRRLAYLREVFDQVDVVISPSQALIDIFARNGFTPDRMLLSRHGLDASWLTEVAHHPPGDRLSFGYVGQIDPMKGVDVLVRAFRTIPDEVDAALSLQGSFEKSPAFSAELRRLAAGDPRIRFGGPFERSEIASVFSALDVLVMPSVWYENAPVVIAEAFAAGKPVVATNLGGMAELVHHEVDGLLFERGDVPGLAATLRRLAEDRDLVRRLARGIPPVRTIAEEVGYLAELYSAAARGTPAGPVRTVRERMAS